MRKLLKLSPRTHRVIVPFSANNLGLLSIIFKRKIQFLKNCFISPGSELLKIVSYRVKCQAGSVFSSGLSLVCNVTGYSHEMLYHSRWHDIEKIMFQRFVVNSNLSVQFISDVTLIWSILDERDYNIVGCFSRSECYCLLNYLCTS